MLLCLLACAASDPADSGDSAVAVGLELPGHNECLPEGERYSAEVCLGVVAEQERSATVSENQSGFEAAADDPRQVDPEYVWLTEQVNRCACACCHTSSWGGAGVYSWDLEWAPVWTDSATLWSLDVFAGLTDEYAQTLPTDDIERVRAYVEAESDRRRALAAE